MAGKPCAVDECRTYSFRNKRRWGKSGIAFTGRTRCAFCYSTPDLEQKKFGDLRTPLLSGTILSNCGLFYDERKICFPEKIFCESLDIFMCKVIFLDSRESGNPGVIVHRKFLTWSFNFEISSNKYDSPLFPGYFLQQSEVPQSWCNNVIRQVLGHH